MPLRQTADERDCNRIHSMHYGIVPGKGEGAGVFKPSKLYNSINRAFDQTKCKCLVYGQSGLRYAIDCRLQRFETLVVKSSVKPTLGVVYFQGELANVFDCVHYGRKLVKIGYVF